MTGNRVIEGKWGQMDGNLQETDIIVDSITAELDKTGQRKQHRSCEFETVTQCPLRCSPQSGHDTCETEVQVRRSPQSGFNMCETAIAVQISPARGSGRDTQLLPQNAQVTAKCSKHAYLESEPTCETKRYDGETVRPGAEFVPWGPLGPPDRIQIGVRPIVQPQPTRTLVPIENDNTANVASSKDYWRRKCRIRNVVLLAAILTIVCTAIGVGVATTQQSSAKPLPALTVMEQPSTSCAYWFNAKQPSSVTQCACTDKISVVAQDVSNSYHELVSQGFLDAVLPKFNRTSTIDLCDPLNQALVWLASGSGKPSTDANLRQRYLLALLYILWNGKTWTSNEGWMSPTSECSWLGITCDKQQNVVALNLGHRNLNGNISSEVALLTSLASLSLQQNNLKGGLPTDLGELSKLTSLVLDGNLLTGTLPTDLGKLTALKDLRLSFNKIHGTIPSEFGLLQSLRMVTLANNTLTGTLPTEIGLLRVETITFGNNLLGGTIPTEIGLLSSTQTLSLSYNNINGTIPNELFNLGEALMFLDLASNRLSGTFPTLIGNLTQIRGFSVENNLLTGTIPTQLGACSYLENILLDHNRFTGTVPTELGLLSQLVLLNLNANKLTGSVPESICRLTRPYSCIATLRCDCGCTCYADVHIN